MRYALLDIGNTAIKAKVFENENLASSFNLGKDTHSLKLFLNELNIDQILISSVVPSINKTIKTIRTQGVLFLNHAHFYELKIHVDPPETVGIDRLVNALAVKARWDTNTIIIDIGTCVTICNVKGVGEYCGGIIMPGFEMVRNALYSGAEQLPLIDFPSHEPKLIGKTTESAMSSGIYFGSIHMINGVVSELKKEDPNLVVILTGGLPSALLDKIEHDEFEPNLQFDGLKILYQNLFAKA